MSGFRSLNNSTSKRVLDLSEPVKLMVWKDVIERVTVIKFRMDNGSGNGAGCFEVEIWADTAKFTNVIVAGFRKCRYLVGKAEKVRCSSKIKPRLRAEWVVVREESCILESCCLSLIRRNLVLEKLRVRRFAVIQEEICCRAFCK